MEQGTLDLIIEKLTLVSNESLAQFIAAVFLEVVRRSESAEHPPFMGSRKWREMLEKITDGL